MKWSLFSSAFFDIVLLSVCVLGFWFGAQISVYAACFVGIAMVIVALGASGFLYVIGDKITFVQAKGVVRATVLVSCFLVSGAISVFFPELSAFLVLAGVVLWTANR